MAARTLYVILTGDWTGEDWREIDRLEGSQEQVIRQAYEKHGDGKAGRYVAIPARSFTPVHVRPEVQTKIKLSPAAPDAGAASAE